MEIFTTFMATDASLSLLEHVSPHPENRFVDSALYSLHRPPTFA